MSEYSTHQQRAVSRVLTAIDTIKSGGMVIMTDDENRENEGDLVFSASDVSPEKINFMAKEARGLICLALDNHYVDKLQLPLMGDHSKGRTPLETAFTVSIEAREGVTTGISAADRARTIEVAIAEASTATDLVVPGHVFPLKAKSGGVLERAGHTEGSVDLSRMAGKKAAGVICEIMNDDGSMARLPDLEVFAQKHDLPIVSIEDLITFRLLKETLVEEVGRKPYETDYGRFEGVWFKNKVDQELHFALVKGTDLTNHCTQVRVHKQNPINDVFGATHAGVERNASRWAIDYALKLLAKHEQAVVVYLSQKSVSGGFLESYTSKPSHMDPRLYGVGAQILKALGVHKMNLHMSSSRPLVGLNAFGLEIQATTVMTPDQGDEL